MADFLEDYLPAIQTAISNHFRVNPDNPGADSSIRKIESQLKFLRNGKWKAKLGGLVFDEDDHERADQFIDTVDELAWYVAQLAGQEGQLPDYL